MIDISFEMTVDPRAALDSLEKGLRKAIGTVPLAVWQGVEQKIFELQAERWMEIIGLGISDSTRRIKKSLYGKSVKIGAGGQTRPGSFVDEFGLETGFLADLMVGQVESQGFTLPRIENGDGIVNGTYVFGIDPTAFYEQYPLELIKTISNRMPGDAKILVDDPERLDQLLMLLWDNMDEVINSVLESEGFSV